MKFVVASLMVLFSAPATWARVELSPAMRQQLMDALISGLHEQGSWSSVHAAEALIATGHGDLVLPVFSPQAELAPAPFRIGVWRILARCAATQTQRQAYVERIRAVLLNPDATDRTHAMEALAKLASPMISDNERKVVNDIAQGSSNVAPFAAWRIAEVDRDRGVDRLIELLRSSDPICRSRAADALARFRPPTDAQRTALELAIKTETADSQVRPCIIEALDGETLREYARTTTDPGALYTVIGQLSRTGTREDLDLLWKSFENANLDVRIASAFAILRICDEGKQP
jgi:HEAT repeat protein